MWDPDLDSLLYYLTDGGYAMLRAALAHVSGFSGPPKIIRLSLLGCCGPPPQLPAELAHGKEDVSRGRGWPVARQAMGYGKREAWELEGINGELCVSWACDPRQVPLWAVSLLCKMKNKNTHLLGKNSVT